MICEICGAVDVAEAICCDDCKKADKIIRGVIKSSDPLRYTEIFQYLRDTHEKMERHSGDTVTMAAAAVALCIVAAQTKMALGQQL